MRRQPAVFLTDLDYGDDISLLSDHMEQAQGPLNRVESVCQCPTGTLVRPEVITYNILSGHSPLTTEGTDVMEGPEWHGQCTELQPPSN